MFGGDNDVPEQEVDYVQQASFQDPNSYLQHQRLKELQNLAMWELNPQDILDQLEHYYKGERWNQQEQKWEKKFDGYLDDEYAAELVNFLASYVNKINFLNDYEEEQINERSWEARKAVALWIRYNYRRAQIDKKDFDMILIPTDAMIYGAYKKSLKGGERRFLGTVHQTQEMTNRNQNQKKGITGIFK